MGAPKITSRGRRWVFPLMAVVVFSVGCGSSQGSAPRTSTSVVVFQVPPPEPDDEPSDPPSRNAVWSAGYWSWTGDEYAWVHGNWQMGRPGYVWVAPHWHAHGRGYLFVEGRWRRTEAGRRAQD